MKKLTMNDSGGLAPTITTSYSRGFAQSTVLVDTWDEGIKSGHYRLGIMEIDETDSDSD